MSKLLIAPATSTAEVDEAFHLACAVFSERNAAASYPTYKAMLWREDPAFAEANIIIGRTAAGELAGIVRIVPRRLHRVDQTMRVAGISSVCVNPALRGRGYSVAIMEHALKHCRSLGYDLSLLIARRAADHFYTQFGFWGVSSYSRVYIGVPKSQPGSATATLDFPPANAAWIECYAQAYAETYSQSFGWFERSGADWAFLLKRAGLLPGVDVRTITLDGKPVGYVVAGSGLVHELAFVDALTADQLVPALASYAGTADGSLELALPPEHRLCRSLANFDWSVRFRECSYGGHMLRILNVDRAADMLGERAARRLGALGCKPLVESVDGVAVRWDGVRSRVELSGQARVRPGYQQTCVLLGALSLSDARESVADSALPFNVSFPDQL